MQFFVDRKVQNMADENILTFNVTNWITIVVMAAAGFFALATIKKYVAAKKGA